MILVKTHIKADEASTKSGIIYPRSVLEALTEMEYTAPGTIGLSASHDPIIVAAMIARNKKFNLVGFDLIEDTLYLKLETEDSKIEEEINSKDYNVKLIASTVFGGTKENREVKKILTIHGVILNEEQE